MVRFIVKIPNSPKFSVVAERESELLPLPLGDVCPLWRPGKQPRQRETRVQEIAPRQLPAQGETATEIEEKERGGMQEGKKTTKG